MSSTKKTKRDQEKAHQAKSREEAKPPKQESERETDPFDFGGLPKRDLKKNLGCG
jgi:hypothetical protein